jgi:hypothetical protein
MIVETWKGGRNPMKLDEFKQVTKSILENLSDQAKVSELLMNLNEDYGTQIAAYDQLSTKVAEQETNITSLQQTNMNLFLKLANPVEQTGQKQDPAEQYTYDDLLKTFE